MKTRAGRWNRDLFAWMGDIEPAWVMLDSTSLNGLMDEPSAKNRVLCLAIDLTADELALSAIARNTLVLLRAAVDGGGLKLTAGGNLSRTTVSAMEEAMTWPGRNPTDARRYRKVSNERDLLQLHFVRTIAAMAELVDQDRGRLRATRLGRDMLDGNGGGLQAMLFHLAFWHLDLAPFGRGLLDAWPQEQIGLVLWSLSVAADEWQTPENLCRLCTIPSEAVLEPESDLGPLIMEARILRPLYWFGLLEYRGEDDGTHAGAGMPHAWRKSALFDRFLGFEVRLEDTGAVLH